nr:retrovirus-related Pol polyprotein from transposon TNT 1-94 [Tanacetum cinerariifolium]
ISFSQNKDAKTLFEAIQARFGGNDAIKKAQRTLLKQMYENFNAPSTKSLDSIFNRLQKIVSQLAILVSAVSTPVSTVSSHDNTANLSDANVYAFLANQPNGSQLVHEGLEQIHEDDLKEMDLKWQKALLSMRARSKDHVRESKLPTAFWAEAVNTACYVQNKVLVVKPHSKTPYELFKGRSPALSFMRPFGCHVTLLNTLIQLGKFDRKSDTGIFVGYSSTSKAFRVYNIRTKKVEENMHITFLENKPMIARGGPEWLFNIDALSKSMNYAPVHAFTTSNDFAVNTATPTYADYAKDPLMPDLEDAKIFDDAYDDRCDNHDLINTATPTYADYAKDPLIPDLEDAKIFDDAYDDRCDNHDLSRFDNQAIERDRLI